MTETDAALDTAAVYQDARARFVDLIRTVPSDDLDRRLPACPRWTARDLVAHLVGVSEDFLIRNFPSGSMTFEEWTEAQVARRRGRDLNEMLADWDGILPAVVESIGNGMSPASPIINDTVTHEQDVRGMAGMPGGRESDGYRFSWERWITGISGRIGGAGLPALVLRTEWGDRFVGEGEAGAVVSAPQFELMRALAGRRSLAQIAAFAWDGDSALYIPLIPTFGPTEYDIVESV